MQQSNVCNIFSHVFINLCLDERLWIGYITANDWGYKREKGRLSAKPVTWLMSAATDEWIKGVCATECDKKEGKRNGKNVCRRKKTHRLKR